MIAALLLGRKGSQGFPGKNTISVLGHPLAWYPMQTALAVREIERVYLSTDDPKLMQIASDSGVNHFSICLSVIVHPGTTEFTLILYCPKSLAKDLVRPTTPDLAAVYAAIPPCPIIQEADPIFTIAPLLFSIIDFLTD